MEMESGTPAEVARKLWGMFRSIVYALRKNLSFCSQSFLIDFHLLLKRTKSCPELFLRHYSSFTCRPGYPDSFVSPSSLHEVEFSCSNTPLNSNQHFLPFKKRRPSSRVHHIGGRGTGRFRYGYGKKNNYNETATVTAVQRVLEMLNRGGVGEDGVGSVMASPMVLPGFSGGKSPTPVRLLRITDSPFPLKEEDDGDDGGQVDVRAEEFIQNFYRDRREEKCMSPYYYGLWGFSITGDSLRSDRLQPIHNSS